MISVSSQVHPIVVEDLKVIIASNVPWSNFQNKTVLITGANGFLPAYLVYTLLLLNEQKKYNIQVVALVRNKQRAAARFGKLLGRQDLKLIVQDVCDAIQYEKEVHYIIHAASQASPKYYGLDPVGTLNANIIGTSNLLSFGKQKNILGFLYFSSSEVYGSVALDKIPTSEGDYGYLDPTNVRSCYAEGKRTGETMCVSWMHQFGSPVKIVRPFHTYGPGMDLDDGRVYADFIADILANRNIVMKSDGLAIRAFCYISDAIEGFFRVLLLGKNGEAYNVGNNECEVSIINLAELLVRMFPEKNLIVERKELKDNRYIKSLVSHISPSIKKIESLAWKPRISVEEGFLRTTKSYL